MMLAGKATAQTFRTLHSFSALTSYPQYNFDGARPSAGLIASNNILYGTASFGGYFDNGTVFKLNTDSAGFSTLHSFGQSVGSPPPPYNNIDGAVPLAGLVLSGNTLYGTAVVGGTNDLGTVFKVNTNGPSLTVLHYFNGLGDGAGPAAGLALAGNTLYGTTQSGGTSNNGTVFGINTDGTGLTNLHLFAAPSGSGGFYGTNSDGINPRATLILSGNTLYGTASDGGDSGFGTVFAVRTDGTGFTNLHSFTATSTNSFLGGYTNSDGARPFAALVLSDNTLYGTTKSGGNSGNGTVFALNTNGTGFTNLHSFTATTANAFVGPYPNTDGVGPIAGLILSGNTLYGTTPYGGSSGYGTVFAVRTDGTGFTNLHSFTATSNDSFTGRYTNTDGANPSAGLTLLGNALYGTAEFGGASGNGTVFSISFRPHLTITSSGSNDILSWPTNVAGFDYTAYTLQFTTNLGSTAIWRTNFPPPVVVNGQNTLTNPISDKQRFYRLSQ